MKTVEVSEFFLCKTSKMNGIHSIPRCDPEPYKVVTYQRSYGGDFVTRGNLDYRLLSCPGDNILLSFLFNDYLRFFFEFRGKGVGDLNTL